MTEKEVLNVLREFVGDVTEDVEPGSVAPETTFEDLDLDSLSVLEIMVSCEERFGVRILEGKAPEITTIGEAIQYLTNRMATAARPGDR